MFRRTKPDIFGTFLQPTTADPAQPRAALRKLCLGFLDSMENMCKEAILYSA